MLNSEEITLTSQKDKLNYNIKEGRAQRTAFFDFPRDFLPAPVFRYGNSAANYI